MVTRFERFERASCRLQCVCAFLILFLGNRPKLLLLPCSFRIIIEAYENALKEWYVEMQFAQLGNMIFSFQFLIFHK